MNDQEIKEFLSGYISEEMDLLHEEEMAGAQHKFSKSFSRRVKRMLWSEKHFGKNIRLGYAVRKAAVVVIICMGMIAANETSARVFGFNPWNYVVSFVKGSRMDKRTYEDVKKSDGDSGEQERPKSVRKEPAFVPIGYKETVRTEEQGGLYIEWENVGKYLQYSRITLTKGMAVMMDAEYDTEEKVELCGYEGQFCTKGQESWVTWDDAEYSYQITATGVEGAREVIFKMAENIYRKK